MASQTVFLKIGLLDNCSHSLKRGYEMWSQWKQTEDAWLLKESVIWIHHGIELALKQLLVETNEFLVFQDVNKAVERLGVLRKKKGMENAGVLDLFNNDETITSVGFRNLVIRTAITLSINELAENAPLRKNVNQLSKYRNNITHFSLELDIVEVSTLLSDILEPLLTLLAREVKDENFRNRDIPDIRRLAQPVQTYIEDMRSGILSDALSETKKALGVVRDRRVGIIWQTLGGGLSQTLISYITEARGLSQLSKCHIIVVVDRIHIAMQIFDQLPHFPEVIPVLPRNKGELSDYLDSDIPNVIITTIQSLYFDRHKTSSKLLIIGYNIHTNCERLVSIFPNALYILFSSVPPNLEVDMSDVFGPLLGRYGFQQAVDDGVINPIIIERISLYSEEERKHLEIGISGPDLGSLKLHENQINNARHIIQHFELRQKLFKGKGVVIVSDIMTATYLSEHIFNIRPEWYGDNDSTGSMKSISSQTHLIERNRLIDRFNDQDDSLSLLIGTGIILAGYENPLVHTAYITCPVSNQLQYRVAGILSRHNKDDLPGVIVDYSNMEWNLE